LGKTWISRYKRPVEPQINMIRKDPNHDLLQSNYQKYRTKKNLNSAREKQQDTFKGNPIRMMQISQQKPYRL
jgi:hypothetical protein